MIKLDSREPEKIGKYFKDANIDVSYGLLPIGDIVCEEKSICIERKAYTDLVSSFQSGHLYLQLYQMAKNYDYCFLFVSGSFKDVWNFSSEDNSKMLAELLIKFPKVRMTFFPNDRQLVNCAIGLIKVGLTDKKADVSSSFSSRLLCAFEGIEPQIAAQSVKDPVVFMAISTFLSSLAKCDIKRLKALAEKELEKNF